MAQDSAKSLRLLIKIEQKKLDQLSLSKADLEAQQHAVEQQVVALTEEMEQEFAKYTGTEFAVALELYVKHAKQQLQNYNTQIKTFKSQIVTIQEQILVVFADLKKYQQLLEKHEEEEKQQRLQKEQDGFDEMNMIGYVRQLKERQHEN